MDDFKYMGRTVNGTKTPASCAIRVSVVRLILYFGVRQEYI